MPSRPFLGCLATVLFALLCAAAVISVIRSQEPDTSGLPEPKTNAEFYVVKRDDAVSVISEKTGIPIEQLERLNPRLDPLNIVPGERIRLRPATARELARRRARARALRRGPRKDTYVVRRGDVLSGIAAKNDLSLGELLDLNRNIKRPDRLQPGDRIRLRE